MLLEDSHGDDVAAARTQLDAIHTAAYELVKIIQELIPSSPDPHPGTLVARVREGLFRPAADLFELSGQLAAREEPYLKPFSGHIESAARDLQQFAAGAGLPEARSGEPALLQVPTAASGAKLLIADDSERNREMLRHQLERQGYAITAVTNGREALQALRGRPFDLVLLDVLMPELDGFAALENIKADPALREIPVIMISASDEYSSVIRCIESGAEDYLPKPFDPVLLRARLKASLEKKALRDEQRQKTEELERAYNHLRKMQDQLITQERLASLGSLSAGIAHEIKNPLNFITNFAAISTELVAELAQHLGANHDDEAREILDDLSANLLKIQDHGHRADRIVRGMLSHARKQSGDRELSDLNALVSECLNLAYHGLRSQDMSFNASIEKDFDPAIGKVNVFPQDLSRVFLNIATNAFHAVAARSRSVGADYDPTIWIRTRCVGESVEIRVRDNGPGIPEEIRQKIFEPFFTTKPAGAGTGLGLSISHDVVVNEHHGELLVESQPGAFTEFIIRIPREVDQ